MADESKINSMLSETDRNREMCNQIVRRVFTDPEQRNNLFRPFGRLVSSTFFFTFHLFKRFYCVLCAKRQFYLNKSGHITFNILLFFLALLLLVITFAIRIISKETKMLRDVLKCGFILEKNVRPRKDPINRTLHF